MLTGQVQIVLCDVSANSQSFQIGNIADSVLSSSSQDFICANWSDAWNSQKLPSVSPVNVNREYFRMLFGPDELGILIQGEISGRIKIDVIKIEFISIRSYKLSTSRYRTCFSLDLFLLISSPLSGSIKIKELVRSSLPILSK